MSNMFGSVLKKNNAKPQDTKEQLQQVDQVAHEQGFVSREAHQRRNHVGPSRAMNCRLPVDVYERFMKFCDDEQLTIRKGIERLLDETGR
ncbi:hypothetical protein [Gluconobacter sp. OJB]|uniref:hypothetical protein n=1 Tax=Gluconobacter sp. OJB TaxID=3145196 RepID=UPI0031FA4331